MTMHERSLTELVSDAFEQLGKLVRNEVDLAKAEAADKAKQAGMAMGFIGAGAVLAMPALVLILFGIASALVRAGVDEPWPYLIVGIVTALVGAGLVYAGASRLSGKAMMPQETMHQLEKDKAAVKEMVR